MPTVNDIKREAALLTKQLENLRGKHKNELEKQEISHLQKKEDARIEHLNQFESLKITNNQKLVEEIQRKEKLLSEMQGQIDQTRKYTSKELERLRTDFQNTKEMENTVFQGNLSNIKLDNSLRIQDANDQGNREIQKLQSQIDLKKNELQDLGRISKKTNEVQNKQQLEEQKQDFAFKHDYNENKFTKTLMAQTKHQKDHLKNLEKKHNTTIDLRSKQYNKLYKNLAVSSNDQLQKQNKYFEERFEDKIKKDNQFLQKLESRKSGFLNKIRSYILDNVNLDIEKSSDPFYTEGEFDYTITKNNKTKELELKLKAPKHVYDSVLLSAREKMAVLSLNRSFEHTGNDENDNKMTTKKVETFTSKIDLPEAVNPKKVTKSYEDGNVVFRIKLV